MGNRIDDIFSPQRLHRNWHPETAPARGPATQPAHADKEPAMSVFLELRSALDRTFRPEDLAAVQTPLAALRELLRQRFPSAPNPIPLAEERERLNQCIHDHLYEIEDLVDALFLGLSGNAFGA